MKDLFLVSLVILAIMTITVSAAQVDPSFITASNLQPVNNSNFTAGTTIELQGNCSIADIMGMGPKVSNATAYLFYYENASFYGSISNASTVSNNTNFNISFASPSQWLNFTWYLNCEQAGMLAGPPDDSGNLSFNLENATVSISNTYFLTSVLSSADSSLADNSVQTVAEIVSLTGSCETNASLANATFWVYDSTGAIYTTLANSSAISNATAFSRSLTLPIQVTTLYWNLECADNESQTTNASANYSFSIVSIGGSGGTVPECASNADCITSDSYCSQSVCIKCNLAKDGICRSCAEDLGIVDPDCVKPTPTATPEPTIEPTAQPTIKSGSNPQPTPSPSPSPAPEPTEEKVIEASSGPCNAGVCSNGPSQIVEIKRRLVVTEENGNYHTPVTLQITNLGEDTLFDTRITEQLPERLTSTQLTFLSQPDEKKNNSIIWIIPELAPGESVYFEYYADEYLALSEFQEPGVSFGAPVLVRASLNFNYWEWPIWYWLILLLLPCWWAWNSSSKHAKAKI